MLVSKEEDARVEEKWARCSPGDVPASCHTISYLCRFAADPITVDSNDPTRKDRANVPETRRYKDSQLACSLVTISSWRQDVPIPGPGRAISSAIMLRSQRSEAYIEADGFIYLEGPIPWISVQILLPILPWTPVSLGTTGW